MRNVSEIIGQRVRSPQRQTMFYKFPNSTDIKVLPAGQPSPVIQSYLPTGWFELKGDAAGNYYLMDSGPLEIVPPDTPDDSNFLERWEGAFTGFFSNTFDDIGAGAGYLREGFRESVSGVGAGFLDLGKIINQALLLIAIIAVVFLLNKILE